MNPNCIYKESIQWLQPSLPWQVGEWCHTGSQGSVGTQPRHTYTIPSLSRLREKWPINSNRSYLCFLTATPQTPFSFPFLFCSAGVEPRVSHARPSECSTTLRPIDVFVLYSVPFPAVLPQLSLDPILKCQDTDFFLRKKALNPKENPPSEQSLFG